MDNNVEISGVASNTNNDIQDAPINEPDKVNSSVNHPSHYNFGKYEVIDVINDWNLNFQRGNAIKYIARAGHKDSSKEVEDLEKARFYIDYEIKRLKESASK